MYTQAEASSIRQKFWTSFGMYMSPVPSATAEKVNWVNYKTGIKGLSFKMNADKEQASVAVEIFLKDTMLQHQYFDIFNSFARQFESMAGKGWMFERSSFVEHKAGISMILVKLKNVNIFKQADWPTMISFLKQYITGLDAFWAAYRPAFELI
ncbi:MAG: DUF4268 domain-containing protein [Ferruginibacter sp.]